MNSSVFESFRRAALVTASLFVLSPSLAAAQYFATTPATYGDQLFFFFDARGDRVPFLTVSNLAGVSVDVQIAYFPRDMQHVLAVDSLTLPAMGHRIIDPNLISSVKGNAGLVVVTPVGGDPLRAVVPPSQPGSPGLSPLFGSFTLANTKLGAGFGQNPFARIAVDVSGNRAIDGSAIDGVDVAYQTFGADMLVVPSYFDPASLSPASEDGNRILLAAFVDEYTGGRWNMGPLQVSMDALFNGLDGSLITRTVVDMEGVLMDHLQSFAGDTTLSGSGKLRLWLFQILPSGGNFFGLFSQALGTFSIGQRMPGFQLAPPVV